MSLNKIMLQGRLTKDVDVKVTTGGVTIATISIAQNDDRDKDKSHFFRAKAFNKTAEFLEKYFEKGSEIIIEGKILNANYEKNGEKVYQDDIIIERVNFCGSKKQSDGAKPEPQQNVDNSEDCPF